MTDLDNYYPEGDNDLPCPVSQAKAFEAELDARMGEGKHWRQVTVYPATLKRIQDEIGNFFTLAEGTTVESMAQDYRTRAYALRWVLDLIEGNSK